MEISQGQTPNRNPERVNLSVGLVAILALALGVWQIRTLIHLPFAVPASTNQSAANLAAGSVEGADVQALQARDTDADGLSDYDELYVYHTSPYLKDSDSDGVDDKTEVTKGTDPTCPQGQTCGPQAFKGAATEALPAGTSSTSPTAAQIRALLKNNGATDQQLASYDDAALLKLYGEVAGSATPSTSTTQPAAPSAPKLQLTADQKAKLNAMSGAELRELMRKGGADSATLNQFDDATLKALAQQVINQ